MTLTPEQAELLAAAHPNGVEVRAEQTIKQAEATAAWSFRAACSLESLEPIPSEAEALEAVRSLG